MLHDGARASAQSKPSRSVPMARMFRRRSSSSTVMACWPELELEPEPQLVLEPTARSSVTDVWPDVEQAKSSRVQLEESISAIITSEADWTPRPSRIPHTLERAAAAHVEALAGRTSALLGMEPSSSPAPSPPPSPPVRLTSVRPHVGSPVPTPTSPRPRCEECGDLEYALMASCDAAGACWELMPLLCACRNHVLKDASGTSFVVTCAEPEED